jgi:hypothetical protein
MRGCVRLSNGVREEDGLHELLPDNEQQELDLASKRNMRREQEGYVTPAEAAAFLQDARRLADLERPPTSPIARTYFRRLASTIQDESDYRYRTPSRVERPKRIACGPWQTFC